MSRFEPFATIEVTRMTVLRRDRKGTSADLVAAIEKLMPLLLAQDEEDAVAALKAVAEQLRTATSSSPEEREAIDKIIDAYEGDHELMAYTHQREGNQWTAAEELSHASSRVLSLARRMR